MNTIKGIEKYLKALKEHDWYYSYSDDHQAYMKGIDQKFNLRLLAMRYDHNFQIWDSIAPDQFKQGAY